MFAYEALREYLRSCGEDELILRFDEIERIIAPKKLPCSARNHRAWWSNGSHSHARAWNGAGYKTCSVDLTGETVVFRRAAG